MKKFVFGIILSLVTLTGCSPRNYFLFNSDYGMRYNRLTGEWQLEWKASAKGGRLDSIPIVVRVDSIE